MNKVILIGKAAAGKDHMRKVLEGRGFTYGTSYTTRPPREGEIDGQDYYFISEKDFKRFADNNYWYEHVEFNSWYYGTSYDQFMNTCNLFVMTPKGVEAINPIHRKDCTIIYLDIPLETRKQRLLERGDLNDKIERRIAADEKDFEGFTDFDIIVNNPNF